MCRAELLAEQQEGIDYKEKVKDEGEARSANISTARHGRAASETTEQRDGSLSNNRRERGAEVRGAHTHTAQHTGSLASSRHNRGILGTAENTSDSLH